MHSSPPPSTPVILVGRDRELNLLRGRLSATQAGQGGLVLISGEAGIGKTALAEALCQEAVDAGALVLAGRCYDLTETPPYGQWVDAFAHYRQGDGMPPLPDAFSRRGTVGEVASQAILFQQVFDFFAALADRYPAVLLLDDLHWADTESLDVLRSLARQLGALPVLIVAAYRSDAVDAGHHLYRLLPLLVRESGAERLDLHSLDDAAVHSLVTRRYDLSGVEAERLTAYLQRRAEGNPLFIGELLRLSSRPARSIPGKPGGFSVLSRTRGYPPYCAK
jgi:predicted ATPase